MKDLTKAQEVVHSQEDSPRAFVALIQQSINGWIQAGEMLVRMEKKNPRVRDEILKLDPRMDSRTLDCFADIGRGALHPELLASQKPGYRALRRCSISVQSKHVQGEPIMVAQMNGKPLPKAYYELNEDDCAQVFSGSRIRTEGEQINWLKAKEQARPKPNFVVEGELVHIRKGGTFSRSELLKILGVEK